MSGPSPARSPLYEAYNAPRYERQKLIREYQNTYSCRLVVMADAIFPYNIAPFEETLYDADPTKDLHVMFFSQGGDGETALRLVRQAQSRCKELVVIVPDQAKSAGTLFALGADQIYMGPTSDLGPIDPQFQLSENSGLVAGKTIIDAVEDAEKRIQKNPETYPLHASLLNDITAILVQQARDAIARTGDQLEEALACVSDRSEDTVASLANVLRGPFIDDPQSHRTVISAKAADKLGLPIKELGSGDFQWQLIWRMWTKYVALDAARIYEGEVASIIFPK